MKLARVKTLLRLMEGPLLLGVARFARFPRTRAVLAINSLGILRCFVSYHYYYILYNLHCANFILCGTLKKKFQF